LTASPQTLGLDQPLKAEVVKISIQYRMNKLAAGIFLCIMACEKE